MCNETKYGVCSKNILKLLFFLIVINTFIANVLTVLASGKTRKDIIQKLLDWTFHSYRIPVMNIKIINALAVKNIYLTKGQSYTVPHLKQIIMLNVQVFL